MLRIFLFRFASFFSRRINFFGFHVNGFRIRSLPWCTSKLLEKRKKNVAQGRYDPETNDARKTLTLVDEKM